MQIVDARAEIIYRAASSMLRTSYGDPPARRPHVIVRLRSDADEVGYGEASPLPAFTGETAESILLQLRSQFLPALIGASPLATGAIHARLDRLPENTSAKAAIDMALYDLAGKALGVPAVDLLGGAMRPDVPVTMPLGIGEAPETAAQAEKAVARGIGTLKMKIGHDPAADIERVRAVRSAVGPAVRIRVDANQGYDVPTAVRLLGKLADLDLEYVEQPVAAWDIKGLAEVRRATGLKIMADESLHSLRDAQRLIEHAAVDLFAIKLIKTSGLTEARAIAALAAAHRIDLVVISPFDTQIGAAAALALALAAPTGDRAHELRVFDNQADLADTAIHCENGRIIPSKAPGLGVASIVELADLAWPAGDADPGPAARTPSIPLHQSAV